MKRAILILALAMAPVWGQEDGSAVITRIVHLKYADANSVTSVIRPFGLTDMAVDPRLMVITLHGHKANVDAAENAIKELDVPSAAPKDVDLTAYFVIGSDAATPPGGPVPADLQSTVVALKQTFAFKSYSLLDTLALRLRAGEPGAIRSNVTGEVSPNEFADFGIKRVSVEGDGMVRIDGLNAGLRRLKRQVTVDGTKPTLGPEESVNVAGVSTQAVDVKDGQKLVIGRSSFEGPGKALFLVLIARVAP